MHRELEEKRCEIQWEEQRKHREREREERRKSGKRIELIRTIQL